MFGLDVLAETLDVTDEVATREWIIRCDSIAPIELVFSNAAAFSSSIKRLALRFAPQEKAVI